MSISHFAVTEEILQFTLAGSLSGASRAIEQFAAGFGSLAAITVPWSSDCTTIVMAVTATQGEGRFLEHTDLGTVRVTDLGNGSVRVAIEPRPLDHPEKRKMAALFVRFMSEIQTRFQVTQ